MIGRTLGNRYKLIAELGSGGMAWVYLADDLLEEQRVAIKVLYPQHSQDIGFLQRFIREAKLSMALSETSPRHIVRVLDYGADRDTHYLVMEYVPGQDLGQILTGGGALPWPRALEIARQVAEALEVASQLEIVHRDIKPPNIMVRPDGMVQVLDFGIAKARTSPDLTLAGFVGSPHYAAPEQAVGKPVDVRSDIYSLGVVLYEMLSGDLPFQGDTPWAVVNQHIVSEPPPLDQARPGLPRLVTDLVHKAMAKQPEDRFQTAADMIQALHAAAAGADRLPEPSPVEPQESGELPESLYQRAMEAVEQERWQEAVALFSQVLKTDPHYEDVSHQLEAVGQQIRLANLYRSATRALERGRWTKALSQLERIAETDPDYRDIKELEARARRRQEAEPGPHQVGAGFSTLVPTDESVISASPEDPHDFQEEEAADSNRVHAVRPRRARFVWLGIPLLVVLVSVMAFWALRSLRPPAQTPSATATASPQSTTLPVSNVTVTAEVPSPASTLHSPTSTATPLPASPLPTQTASRSPTETPAPPSPTPTATATLTPTDPATQPPPRTAAVRPSLAGQIAFPRFDPSRGTYDVFVCLTDGSGCRQVAAQASQPDFVPDGSQIVIHSWKADEKGLVLLSLFGDQIWRITDMIEAARPSADFQGIAYAFHSRNESDRRPRLYRTYAADISPVKREANVVLGQSPSWLPDQRLLYSGCWLDACGILVMQGDGSSPRQVVAGSTEANPEASPDGRQVAFMSFRDGNWEVYSVKLDGSGLRRLTTDPSNDGLPTWSPDGRTIAFVSDRGGRWAVWAMRPDGSAQQPLFDLGGPLDGRVRDAASHETHGWVEERISWAPLP